MEELDQSVVIVEDPKLFIIDEFGSRTETNNDGSLSSIPSEGTDENDLSTTRRPERSQRRPVRRRKRRNGSHGPAAASTPLPLNVVASNQASPRVARKRKRSQPPTPSPRKRISTVMISSDESSSSDESVVLVPCNHDDIIELSDDEDVGVCTGSVARVSRSSKKFKIFKNVDVETKPEPHRPPLVEPTASKPAARPASNKLRPVVVDGSNVAFGHGLGVRYSGKGLKICVDYFLRRGHKVVVFVPQFRRRHPATTDQHILDELEKEGILTYTPSRKVQGKTIASYDDRFIVEYAHMSGGVVVSRDNYRDLLAENPSWKDTIEKRLLMFTWVGDVIMFPSDPLGRGGPSLEDVLKF